MIRAGAHDKNLEKSWQLGLVDRARSVPMMLNVLSPSNYGGCVRVNCGHLTTLAVPLLAGRRRTGVSYDETGGWGEAGKETHW